jgi:hypothetical protein
MSWQWRTSTPISPLAEMKLFTPTKHIARLLTMVVEQQEHNTYSQG